MLAILVGACTSNAPTLLPRASAGPLPTLAMSTPSTPPTSMPTDCCASPSPAASSSAGWQMATRAVDDARGCTNCSEVRLAAVAKSAGPYVAVGLGEAQEAMIWTSVDGLAWARVPDGPAFDQSSARGVAASGGTIVAVGLTIPTESTIDDAVIWKSSDGATWHREPPTSAVRRAIMNGVVAGGPGFVAVGQTVVDPGPGPTPAGRPAIWWSAAGTLWQRAALPSTLTNGSLVGIVATPGGHLLAYGASRDKWLLLESIDGLTWTITAQPRAEDGSVIGGVRGIAAVGGTLWALAGAGLAKSADGVRWTFVGFQEPIPYGGLVAVGRGGVDWYVPAGDPYLHASVAFGGLSGDVDLSDPSWANEPFAWTTMAAAGDWLFGFASTGAEFAIWARPLALRLPTS